jgi:hypothetical protein
MRHTPRRERYGAHFWVAEGKKIVGKHGVRFDGELHEAEDAEKDDPDEQLRRQGSGAADLNQKILLGKDHRLRGEVAEA